MTVSSIGVDDASTPDKLLHTEQRSISGSNREDQYVQQGESAYNTFSFRGSASIATSGDHLLQIMADGTNYTRLKRVYITATADIPASADVAQIQLVRLSTAGTGGGTVNAQEYDSADTYGGAGMTLPSSKGTEGVALYEWHLGLPATQLGTPHSIVWEALPGMKPIIFGTATSAGVAFKIITGIASTTVLIMAECISTSYL